MAITKEELNLIEIFKDLGNICQTEAVCGKCSGPYCLVGYSKECAAACRIKKQTFVDNGYENIPPSDIRGGYDEFEVLHAISHLLLQCRSCKQDHYENCVINVIRSCLEVIEFGDEQIYEGDPLSYMIKIANLDTHKGDIMREEYMAKKERDYLEKMKEEK